MEVLAHIVLMFARYSILVQFCSCTFFPSCFFCFTLFVIWYSQKERFFVVHKYYYENTVRNVNAIYPDVNFSKKAKHRCFPTFAINFLIF